MSKSTKLLLASWIRTFVASVSTALAALGAKPWLFSVHQIVSIIFGALAATVAVAYNYFNKNDPRFGKTVAFVAKEAIAASNSNLSAPVKADAGAIGNYLEHLASENGSTTQITPGA